VCENKVLLYDLLSRKVSELPKVSLEGKSATCVSFLFLGGQALPSKGSWVMQTPVLAFGCSDGIVRLIELGSNRLVMRLVSTHKSSIQCISTLAVRGCHWEQVVVGHSYGSLASWEPFSRNSVGGDMHCKADVKAHDKEVVGLVLACVQEAAEQGSRQLVTAGIDNRLMSWDPVTLKETNKIKLDPKAQTTCMTVSPRGFVSANTHSILVGTEVGVLLSLHPVTGSVRLVCNLQGLIPSGQKRQPKVYWVSVHPLQPAIVCVGTNVGSVLLGLENLPPLPAAPLPLRHPSHAHVSPGKGASAAAGQGMTYVMAAGEAGVVCLTLSTVEQQAAAAAASAVGSSSAMEQLLEAASPSNDIQGSATQLPHQWPRVQVMSKFQLAAGDGRPRQRAVITASHDGTYVAVAWPSARQYSVYRQGAASWDEVCHGSGSSVAWHSSEPCFAVLEESAAEVAAAPAGKLSKKPSKKDKGGKEEAKVVAPTTALLQGPRVQVRRLEGRSMSVLHESVRLPSKDSPAIVYSGPLLAVTYKRALKNCDLISGSDTAAAMQFYSWDGAYSVAEEVPEPLVLAWDPSLQYCAMAYSTQVVICTASPTFRVVASLPISSTTCMEWGARQLFIGTPTHIYLAFIALPTATSAGVSPPIQVITLASFSEGVAAAPTTAAVALLHSTAVDSLVPPPMQRPAGPLLVLGPRDGNLWVLNAHGQPLALPLSAPGLRVMCLISGGEMLPAVQMAARSLPHSQHDSLAAFLVDMEGVKGAMQALRLPGLSLVTEAGLRMQCHHWQQSMEAVEALLAGFTHRPAPGTFNYPETKAAFISTTSTSSFAATPSFSTRGAALDEGEWTMLPAAGTTAAGTAAAAVGSPPLPDELDWSQPLHQASTAPVNPAAAAVAAAAAASGTGSSSNGVLPPTSASTNHSIGYLTPEAHAGIELGLSLLESLISIGMADAARHLVRLLVRDTGALSAAQLSRVVLMLARSQLTSELPALAAAIGPGGDALTQESVGLLAAAFSKQPALLQELLRQARANSLAAVQAAAFRLPTAAASLTQWKQALLAVSGGESSTHFTVTAATV